MTKDLFDKYIWLVDTIYRAGKITFEEINERWLRSRLSEGEDIPLRTFHNWRIAIEQVFDININCNRKGGYYYYIENADDMQKGGIRNWLLNTFAVNNLINESHHLKRRILFEEIPSGRKYLTPVIEAMRDGLELELYYQSYWYEEPSTYTLQPYCIKVFKQRWYVIGFCKERNNIRTFSLDRIQQLTTLDTKFIYPKDFDNKEKVVDVLDHYNQKMEDEGKEEQVISYTDIVGTMMSSVTTIINTISYVLIAFVAISLIVSSIMIGVITYISVLERKKEIGILRAIGASKGNISQVFNAETFIIGLCAGLIGIGLTLLILIPGNMLIHALADNNRVSAILPIAPAIVLILLSVVLTLLGGLIPSRKAAKSDPVTALRTE